MPQFNDVGPNDVEASGVAGVGGTLQAIPFINVLAPGITELFATQGKEKAINQMGANAQNIQDANFGSDSGVQAQYSGDFNPEMLRTPEAAQYQTAQDSAEGRAAQLAALQEMSQLANQSAGSQARLGRNTAEMDARQLAQSREGAIKQDAMRRGQVGGAADMIARQQAAQAASNQNLDAGLQNAQMAALQQLAGNQASGQLAGQMRGQDNQLAMGNAGIINAFNMANTTARNNTNNANTGLTNQAGMRNLDARQGVMNADTALDWNKLNRNDSNAQTQFGNQMTKYNAVNNALAAKAGLFDKARADAAESGKTGMSNFKDAASMAAGVPPDMMGKK